MLESTFTLEAVLKARQDVLVLYNAEKLLLLLLLRIPANTPDKRVQYPLSILFAIAKLNLPKPKTFVDLLATLIEPTKRNIVS